MMRFETFKAFQTIKTSNSKSKLLISRKAANRNNNNENFCSAKLDRSVAKTTQNPSKSRGSHNLFVLAGAPSLRWNDFVHPPEFGLHPPWVPVAPPNSQAVMSAPLRAEGPPRAAGCGDPERSGGSEHRAARGGPAERNHPFRTEHNAGAAGARDKHEKTVTNALETHWSERQTSKNVSHTAFGASFPFSFYSFCLKRYLSLCMTAIFVWHDNFSFGTCQTL